MKAKNLFLTIALFLLLPLSVKAATATDVFVVPSGTPNVYATVNPSSYGSTSGATYSGEVDYDSNYPLVWLDNSKVWATIGSPGKAKSVTIYWDRSGDYNDETSIIRIYGQNTPYTGSETLGTMTGSLLGSQTYNGSESHTIDISAGDCDFIAIVGSPDAGIAFKRLEISWTVPDVTTYAISTTKTGKGSISVSPASPVAEGVSVTVTFTGTGSANEINSYVIDGVTTVLTEDEYKKSTSATFVMPDHDVDISAVFAAKPSRGENAVSINSTPNVLAANIESGVERNFTISTQENGGSSPAYTAGLKSVTSTYGKVSIVGNTFNASTGTGTLTLRGLASGYDEVVITTYQTNGYQRSTATIQVTVVARDIALVTELNGKYYAVTNSPSGTTVAAVELFEEGGTYYYKSAGDLTNISWKAENSADGYYIRNSADQYLKVAGTTMSLSGSEYQWYKNPGGAFVTGYTTGICYDESYSAFVITGQNDHSSVSTISACVHEIPVASLALATEYTRSLTNGNYATMCLPFAVSASETFFSGAEVYIIVGKHVSAGNVTSIELEQVTDNLVAGKPYVILATASTLSAWHGDDLVGSPVNGDGLVGNLNTTPLIMPDGTYGISGNQLRKINGGTGKVKQYRAYIDLDGIPEVKPSPAPGRRVIYTESTATSVEDLLENATLINWNEPVYNIMGQRVSKGTTGVLIQNGQKFLIQ